MALLNDFISCRRPSVLHACAASAMATTEEMAASWHRPWRTFQTSLDAVAEQWSDDASSSGQGSRPQSAGDTASPTIYHTPPAVDHLIIGESGEDGACIPGKASTWNGVGDMHAANDMTLQGPGEGQGEKVVTRQEGWLGFEHSTASTGPSAGALPRDVNGGDSGRLPPHFCDSNWGRSKLPPHFRDSNWACARPSLDNFSSDLQKVPQSDLSATPRMYEDAEGRAEWGFHEGASSEGVRFGEARLDQGGALVHISPRGDVTLVMSPPSYNLEAAAPSDPRRRARAPTGAGHAFILCLEVNVAVL
jgi:hypothetical protein